VAETAIARLLGGTVKASDQHPGYPSSQGLN